MQPALIPTGSARKPAFDMGGPASEAFWREMAISDLDGVIRVAREAFPDHFEDRRCFAERLKLFPQGCFVLDEGTGRMLGYLIAYPWTARSAPPLNSLVQALPNDAEVLYLHDLALLREAQGKNLTRIIIDRLADQARRDGWRAIALVAVNDATAFWAKAGFAEADEPAMREKLASYGAGATYMTRTLGA
ncbi:GNAT family N-acetyltransferase [Novosphingobium sp. G106]|uniref:GNAT family N-acetyltransferase n=1 Tax=Novosphingobium sp. G106 TaxID=2849500 RepID=UPI0020C21070|nr:GNAT family N-acetyltransferase [Novosphingobium sp. G106]